MFKIGDRVGFTVSGLFISMIEEVDVTERGTVTSIGEETSMGNEACLVKFDNMGPSGFYEYGVRKVNVEHIKKVEV